jgi:hypothetical protein
MPRRHLLEYDGIAYVPSMPAWSLFHPGARQVVRLARQGRRSLQRGRIDAPTAAPPTSSIRMSGVVSRARCAPTAHGGGAGDVAPLRRDSALTALLECTSATARAASRAASTTFRRRLTNQTVQYAQQVRVNESTP